MNNLAENRLFTFLAWRTCIAVPMSVAVTRAFVFDKAELIAHAQSLRYLDGGDAPRTISRGVARLKYIDFTDSELKQLEQVSAFEFAARLDGIVLFRFRLSTVVMDEDRLEKITMRVARILCEVIKSTLNHHHEFHRHNSKRDAFLTPKPVRIADSIEEACSKNIQDKIATWSEGTTSDSLAPADRKLKTLIEEIVWGENIADIKLEDVLADEPMLGRLTSHVKARIRSSNGNTSSGSDVRAPQFALLRYRENISRIRRRCSIAVALRKDFAREDFNPFWTIKMLAVLGSVSMFLDALLHLFYEQLKNAGVADHVVLFKFLPWVMTLSVVVLPVAYLYARYKDREYDEENEGTSTYLWALIIIIVLGLVLALIGNSGIWPSFSAVMAIIVNGIVTMLAWLWSQLAILYDPISSKILDPVLVLWDKIKENFPFELKAYAVFIGVCYVSKWLVISNTQYRQSINIIRRTIGVYAFFNIYAHCISALYNRCKSRINTEVNTETTGFSDIIQVLESKHDGEVRHEEFARNTTIGVISGVALLIAFAQFIS